MNKAILWLKENKKISYLSGSLLLLLCFLMYQVLSLRKEIYLLQEDNGYLFRRLSLVEHIVDGDLDNTDHYDNSFDVTNIEAIISLLQSDVSSVKMDVQRICNTEDFICF